MVSSHRFNRIFARSVVIMAVLCLVAAFYFFNESPGEPVFVLFGVGLVIGAIAMIWGAKQTLKEADVKERIEQRVNQHVTKRSSFKTDENIDLEDSKVNVIAHWKIPKKDWQKQTALLTKKNKTFEVVVAIGIVVISGLTIFIGMEPSILIAGIFVAILFYVLRIKTVSKTYKVKQNEADVLITDQFIRMNDHFVHFKNGTHFLKDIELHSDPIHYLLLVIAWPTGRGFDNSMDWRIPVPDYEIENIQSVVSQLEGAKKTKSSTNLVEP